MSNAKVEQRHNEAARSVLVGLKLQRSVCDYAVPAVAQALAAAEAAGRQGAEWIPFDAETPPPPNQTVQFWTHAGQSVGARSSDRGKGHEWEDLCDVDMCGDCETYSDDQVTHWAPLLGAPPKAEAAK